MSGGEPLRADARARAPPRAPVPLPRRPRRRRRTVGPRCLSTRRRSMRGARGGGLALETGGLAAPSPRTGTGWFPTTPGVHSSASVPRALLRAEEGPKGERARSGARRRSRPPSRAAKGGFRQTSFRRRGSAPRRPPHHPIPARFGVISRAHTHLARSRARRFARGVPSRAKAATVARHSRRRGEAGRGTSWRPVADDAEDTTDIDRRFRASRPLLPASFAPPLQAASDVFIELILVNDRARVDAVRRRPPIGSTTTASSRERRPDPFRVRWRLYPRVNLVPIAQFDFSSVREHAGGYRRVPPRRATGRRRDPGGVRGVAEFAAYGQLPAHDAAHLFSGGFFTFELNARGEIVYDADTGAPVTSNGVVGLPANQWGAHCTSICEEREASVKPTGGRRGTSRSRRTGGPAGGEKRCCARLLRRHLAGVQGQARVRRRHRRALRSAPARGSTTIGVQTRSARARPPAAWPWRGLFEHGGPAARSPSVPSTRSTRRGGGKGGGDFERHTSVCGNGLVEPGEKCDCGGSDCASGGDPCCGVARRASRSPGRRVPRQRAPPRCAPRRATCDAPTSATRSAAPPPTPPPRATPRRRAIRRRCPPDGWMPTAAARADAVGGLRARVPPGALRRLSARAARRNHVDVFPAPDVLRREIRRGLVPGDVRGARAPRVRRTVVRGGAGAEVLPATGWVLQRVRHAPDNTAPGFPCSPAEALADGETVTLANGTTLTGGASGASAFGGNAKVCEGGRAEKRASVAVRAAEDAAPKPRRRRARRARRGRRRRRTRWGARGGGEGIGGRATSRSPSPSPCSRRERHRRDHEAAMRGGGRRRQKTGVGPERRRGRNLQPDATSRVTWCRESIPYYASSGRNQSRGSYIVYRIARSTAVASSSPEARAPAFFSQGVGVFRPRRHPCRHP